MLSRIHFIATRLVAWPLVLIGMVLVQLGGRLILSGAWIADVDVNRDDEWL